MLLIGAAQEDLAPAPAGTLGGIPSLGGIGNAYRYFFHFDPALSFGVLASANCTSLDWGLGGAPCTATCSFPGACSLGASAVSTNDHSWGTDVLTPDTMTGDPSASSIKSFGYVVHLLEDLGSPPHTRNEPHPCPSAFSPYCDPFENDNDGASPSLQVALMLPTGANAVIPTTGFTTPTQFFQALQIFVRSNYYSNDTVLESGLPVLPPPPAGPLLPQTLTDLSAVARYIFGACTTANGFNLSAAAGNCKIVAGQPVRKIAHKGPLYWACVADVGPVLAALGDCDTNASIDTTIAQEQFAELGPVIAQHVAAFVQFYAPALTVQVQGNGTVTSTNLVFPSTPPIPGTFSCTSGTCSALFVQGTVVTLTADPGSTVTWGGACSGNAATVTVVLTSDQTCTATFQPASLTGDVVSGSYDYPAFGVPYYAFSYSTNPVTVSPGGAATTFNINGGLPCCGAGTNFTADFTANSLTVRVVSGGGGFCGCGASFNGPVFTVTSPQSFPAVSSVSSNVVGLSGVTVTGGTIGINFQGLNVPNGSYVVVNFGP